MVLTMLSRTAVPKPFVHPMPQIATARRTISERWRPRYFTPGAAGDKPSWELDTREKLWEIGSDSWWPFSSFTPPDHLDGSLPGDRGFDPFNLGQTWGSPPAWSKGGPEEARLPWLLEGELYNGRLAMLAAVGIITVELQGKGPWWTIPAQLPHFGIEYIVPVIATHVVFAFAEKTRLENFGKVGEAGHFFLAPFDPAGLAQGDYGDYMRQAEVRNARLAMLATLGFAVQAWVTGTGPIEGAAKHLADPFGYNIFTQGDKGLQVVAAFLAISVGVHVAEIARNRETANGSRRPRTVSG